METGVRIISAKETIPVRHSVLRKGRSIEDCVLNGDYAKTTIHLGAFNNGELVGVATFLKETHADFSENNQYQLRGMGVLENFQGKGIGKQLISEAERQLKKLGATLLWCNAREIAWPFYKNNGYQQVGDPFEVETIGKHLVFFKWL